MDLNPDLLKRMHETSGAISRLANYSSGNIDPGLKVTLKKIKDYADQMAQEIKAELERNGLSVED